MQTYRNGIVDDSGEVALSELGQGNQSATSLVALVLCGTREDLVGCHTTKRGKEQTHLDAVFEEDKGGEALDAMLGANQLDSAVNLDDLDVLVVGVELCELVPNRGKGLAVTAEERKQ